MTNTAAGATTPATRITFPHAECGHAPTKAGRAACRRARTKAIEGHALDLRVKLAPVTEVDDTFLLDEPIQLRTSTSVVTKPRYRFIVLDVKTTKTGYAYHTNTFRSLLAFAKAPVKYATSVTGPTGDYFETRSFLDAPVN